MNNNYTDAEVLYREKGDYIKRIFGAITGAEASTYLPVLPKPPAPLSLSSKESTTTISASSMIFSKIN